MTSLTLKMRSRSNNSNLVFVLPWCSCVPYLVRIRKIFLQILSGNHLAYHLSYVLAFNNLCDLENEVKVTLFELGLRLVLVLQCTKCCKDKSNISWNIEQKPSFISHRPKWPPWPCKWGHPFRTLSSTYPCASVYHIWWGYIKKFWDIERKPSCIRQPARLYKAIT